MSDKPWGGRFKESTSLAVEAYTESISFDSALYAQDIAGSKAHARMLGEQGVITREEAARLIEGLDQVKREIEEGSFPWKQELEDVHMNIETRLTQIVGEVGKKLHTGRSRNDQVCLDFRLFVSDQLRGWIRLSRALIAMFVRRADENRSVLLPGCTHMQPAQPVSLAQHLLAYAWMLKRDVERMVDCERRVRVSPLGAAALAGTTYPLNPAMVAEELGMYGIFDNSMDAVADRDFALEALFCGSTCMAHLSRFCEEIIWWANPLFGYITLSDKHSTGSSIMPQKKNPDVAEIMRGKTGRVYGNLVSLMTIMKGIPLTYNRDLQEDKIPFLDTDKTVRHSLSLMADMLEGITFHPERMRKALAAGFLNATELADYLVTKGMPFREAHHVSGRAVAMAEDLGIGLEDLTLEQLRSLSDLIDEDVFTALDYDTAVARRNVPGGTGPESVKRQLENIRRWLDGGDK
ncbi:argininosuccinate lyase [Mailhella sp.]|uniref:argininosuccinate lyase n=1 Tax=Mailhella sp. TaxID=1981029 RepID=UPI003AB29209